MPQLQDGIRGLDLAGIIPDQRSFAPSNSKIETKMSSPSCEHRLQEENKSHDQRNEIVNHQAAARRPDDNEEGSSSVGDGEKSEAGVESIEITQESVLLEADGRAGDGGRVREDELQSKQMPVEFS